MESQEFNSDQPRQGFVSNGEKRNPSMPRGPQMSRSVFEKIREVIYHQSGLYYTDKKKRLLEACISKRLIEKKMVDFDEYIKFLKSPFGRQEMNNMFETQAVNKTYFFRAEYQFQAFENVIVPEILGKKSLEKTPIFKIWSAATCTGEEAYTLALIVREKLQTKYPNVEFQIIASDINRASIQKAEEGNFTKYSVKNIPQNYLEKYFTKQDDKFLINPDIKKMVRFVKMNLYDIAAIESMKGCDVVFCANVLIYFDPQTKQKVLSAMYDSINNGGYLFIGCFESLHGVSSAFNLIHLPKAMVYKKGE